MKVKCYFCKRKMKKRPLGYVFYSPASEKFPRLSERFIKVVNWCKACQVIIDAYNTCVREANKKHREANESFEDFWARGGTLGKET